MALVQDNEIYHYHLDHLGTPRELTNEKGKIVWRVKYRTYGNVVLKDIEEIENNLRFQGQYFDEETGLHYNRFRYYNPGTGQFINQDPIGLAGGINNYQYADNPTGWVDPFGLCNETANPPPEPGRVFSGLKAARVAKGTDETVDLFRAVGVREYDSIMKNKAFIPGGTSLEGRQFALSLDEALKYANIDITKAAIMKVTVKKNALKHFDFSKNIDPFIFKNGVYTVQPGAQSKILQQATKRIEHTL